MDPQGLANRCAIQLAGRRSMTDATDRRDTLRCESVDDSGTPAHPRHTLCQFALNRTTRARLTGHAYTLTRRRAAGRRIDYYIQENGH